MDFLCEVKRLRSVEYEITGRQRDVERGVRKLELTFRISTDFYHPYFILDGVWVQISVRSYSHGFLVDFLRPPRQMTKQHVKLKH